MDGFRWVSIVVCLLAAGCQASRITCEYRGVKIGVEPIGVTGSGK